MACICKSIHRHHTCACMYTHTHTPTHTGGGTAVIKNFHFSYSCAETTHRNGSGWKTCPCQDLLDLQSPVTDPHLKAQLWKVGYYTSNVYINILWDFSLKGGFFFLSALRSHLWTFHLARGISYATCYENNKEFKPRVAKPPLNLFQMDSPLLVWGEDRAGYLGNSIATFCIWRHSLPSPPSFHLPSFEFPCMNHFLFL